LKTNRAVEEYYSEEVLIRAALKEQLAAEFLIKNPEVYKGKQ